MQKFKCTAEAKLPRQTYPYWGRFIDDETVILVMLERDDKLLMVITEGGKPRFVDPKSVAPIPESECRGWHLKLGVDRAELVRATVRPPDKRPERDALEGASFPGLFRHPSTGTTTVLMSFVAEGAAVPAGYALYGKSTNGGEGTMRTDIDCRGSKDWEQIEGEVTLENRPGVEFPRLYRGESGVVRLRTAKDVWFYVDGIDQIVPSMFSDKIHLQTKPGYTPLPDGTKLTLKFTKA